MQYSANSYPGRLSSFILGVRLKMTAYLCGTFGAMWGYEGVTDVDIRLLAARRVRQWRRARGQSTRALSVQLGFAPNYMSEFEHGQRRAPFLTLWALAAHFERTIEELLGPPRTRDEHEWFLHQVANRAPIVHDDDGDDL